MIASAGSALLRRVPPNHERIIDLQPPPAGFIFSGREVGATRPTTAAVRETSSNAAAKRRRVSFEK